jgi:hypothetical protein
MISAPTSKNAIGKSAPWLVEVHERVGIPFQHWKDADEFCRGILYAMWRDYEEPDRSDYTSWVRRGSRFAYFVERYTRLHRLSSWRLPCIYRIEYVPGGKWKKTLHHAYHSVKDCTQPTENTSSE